MQPIPTTRQQTDNQACLMDAHEASSTTGDFVVEGLAVVGYVRVMSQTLESRVKALERKMARLGALPIRPNRRKDWRRTIGIFQNDKDFDQAVRFGHEYRKRQTYHKEIAGS